MTILSCDDHVTIMYRLGICPRRSYHLMQNVNSEAHASHSGCASPSEAQHANVLFDGTYKIGIGVYDGLSALLAEKGKFDFAWISSFCCSAALGLPDAGIVGPEEILSVVR